MIIIFLALILCNFIIFFYLKKFSKIINIYDKPDNYLKKHESDVPLLGGIIIIINLLIFFFLIFFFDTFSENIKFSKKEQLSMFFLVIFFFLMGVYDDKFKLKPNTKLILSIFVSTLVLTFNNNLLIENISFSFLNRNIFLGDFSYFFTIFCIIILINALNFYDGINGQSLIFFIMIFSYLAFQSPLKIFYITLISICIFILLLNLQNKIFLGDSGIYTLGSILVILLIYEHNHFKTLRFSDEIFLLLILPGVDLLRLTCTRIINGKNAFYGDRNHLHHMLFKKNNLLISNIILFFLSILPIFLFSILNLNFFAVFFIFVLIYLILILKLNINVS
jgi:UDP-GlcNAc:undecaprenyl-phosphate GlcNAc-1-phosphate transferase